MKVAVHLPGAAVQGNERQLLLVCAGLRSRGHQVVVSCRPDGPVAEALAREGIPTTAARPRGDADAWNALRFVAWLRRERPDALLQTSWKRALVAGWAARLAGVPRVVLRIGGPRGVPRGAEGWKYRRAVREADALLLNAPGLVEHFRARVPGLRPERIHVVPNAVQFHSAPPSPLRAEVGAAPDDLLLLAAGGLWPHKGFHLLVEALARVAHPRLRLVIAGDGGEAGALRAQAEGLGVGDRVHLLGHRSDLAAVMAAADAFVLSSRLDSMANVMLEAMAAGLPVLATDVPGSADALLPRSGRPAAGWVVPSGDAEALAGGLRTLAAALGPGGDAPARAAEGRWRIAHWFTAERMVDGVEAVLRGEPASPAPNGRAPAGAPASTP